MALNFKSLSDNPEIDEINKNNLKNIINNAIDDDSFLDLVAKLYYLDNYGKKTENETGRRTDIVAYATKDGDIALTWVTELPSGIKSPWMHGGLVHHKHDNSWGVHT